MNLVEYLNTGKISKMLKHPISDDEIKTILGKDAKVITYPDLAKYENIDFLLPRPNDFCIILIVEDQNKYQIQGTMI